MVMLGSVPELPSFRSDKATKRQIAIAIAVVQRRPNVGADAMMSQSYMGVYCNKGQNDSQSTTHSRLATEARTRARTYERARLDFADRPTSLLT